MTQAYRIENLDVYRKAISIGTRLYSLSAGEGSAVQDKLRETSLSMVLNLASGLGFWEKEFKTQHFKACKTALLEIMPLLELKVTLGEITAEKGESLSGEVQDLAKMVGGLLRQATRKKEE